MYKRIGGDVPASGRQDGGERGSLYEDYLRYDSFSLLVGSPDRLIYGAGGF